MTSNRALPKDIVPLRRTSLIAVQRGDNGAIDPKFLPPFQQPHLSFRLARMADDPSHLLFVKVKPDISNGDAYAALEGLDTKGYEFEEKKSVIFSFNSWI
jgi:hypothetical protein